MPLPIIQTVLLFITVSQIASALHEQQQQQQQSTDSCDLEITSKMDKSGTITSPNYPNQYPANLRCSYRFRSQNAERVQLVFTDFDLYQPPDQENSLCRGEFDHFSAYVDLDGRMSEVDTFCGVEMPPQLMSSQNLIAAEFVTHQYIVQPKRPYRGFRMIYRFVTDFGIKSGRSDSSHSCSFYYSSAESTNGTFYSPNYPGYYPRKTECHYTFDGAPNQKVRLTFTYFDVEGFGQCDNESQSDFIEFSNYRTMDRKLPRYCGNRKPPEKGVESENDFYHVIFSSNSIFDATGFFGFYQFTSKEGKHPLRRVKSAAWKMHGWSNAVIVSAILCTISRLPLL
ncbi:Suppressor of lurcher protein 1 [Trichinella murrelli]|uniref:Suppressor of lurcher protein 1 n=1 Tax=Trichinella murrelli TaxID=144512 RepID=A0A0V0UBD5_9BILA|nr:Suppressor of lurcher protein 1 [Trichinella murrelli]